MKCHENRLLSRFDAASQKRELSTMAECAKILSQPANLATNVKTVFTCLLDQISQYITEGLERARYGLTEAAALLLLPLQTLLLLVKAVLDLSWLLSNVVEAVWL